MTATHPDTIWAAQYGNTIAAENNPGSLDGDGMEYISRAAHDAAVSAARKEGVRVKALEWHEQSRDGRGYITGQWWAEALGGAYLISVYTTADDGCLLTLGHFMRDGSVKHPTIEAAKAAAQADYEARILSALETTP